MHQGGVTKSCQVANPDSSLGLLSTALTVLWGLVGIENVNMADILDMRV